MRSFEVYLQQQNLKPSTIAAYLKDMRCFETWECRLDERQRVGQAFVFRVEAFLAERKLSSATRNRYLASLSRLHEYRELHVPEAQQGAFVMAHVRRASRAGRKVGQPLSLEEVKRLVHAVHRHSRPTERVRNGTLIHFLATSGLKTREVCMFKLDDVHMTSEQPSYVSVNRARSLHVFELSQDTQKYLRCWLYEREQLIEKLQGSPYVWPVLSANRRKRPGDPLSEQGVRAILSRYARLEGIEQRVTPKQLLTSHEQKLDCE